MQSDNANICRVTPIMNSEKLSTVICLKMAMTILNHRFIILDLYFNSLSLFFISVIYTCLKITAFIILLLERLNQNQYKVF